MNQLQNHFVHVERRIAGVKVNRPAGWENYMVYLQMAHDDVLGRLSPEELAEIRASQAYVPTEAEKRRERAREVKEMEANKDKPSH